MSIPTPVPARDAPAGAMNPRQLLAELQALGLGSGDDADSAPPGRRGGAGPSDHRAVSLGAHTLMVPTGAGKQSPFRLRVLGDDANRALLLRDGQPLAEVEVPTTPRFYALATAEGVPYAKIALLHSRRVLASTVLQSCVRYADPAKACQFCAIGTSLREGPHPGAKKPNPAGRGGRSGGSPRWHRAGGVDHGNPGHARPRRRASGRVHRRDQTRGARLAGAGAVRAPGGPPALVQRATRRRRRRARAAPRGGRARGAGRGHAGQGRGSGGTLLRGVRGGGRGLRPRPGQHLSDRRPGRRARQHRGDGGAPARCSAFIPSWCPSSPSRARRWPRARHPRPR